VDMHDRLLEIFQALEFETDDISDGTNLKDELGIDSTEFAEIAVAIEREFLVVVNDDELNQVKTFGDLIQFVSCAPPAKRGD
jgi:acyl carrier protein